MVLGRRQEGLAWKLIQLRNGSHRLLDLDFQKNQIDDLRTENVKRGINSTLGMNNRTNPTTTKTKNRNVEA